MRKKIGHQNIQTSITVDRRMLNRLKHAADVVEFPPFKLVRPKPKGAYIFDLMVIRTIEQTYNKFKTKNDMTLVTSAILTKPGLTASERAYAIESYPDYLAYQEDTLKRLQAKKDREAKAEKNVKEQAEADQVESMLKPEMI